MMATADDFGYLNLMRFPNAENCDKKVYRGHSEHVTNVVFNEDDS